jgi:trk system potassium uptake protein TrkA
MITIAVIGLGTFGSRVADELVQTDANVIILDKDREAVERYKTLTKYAYITDAISEDSLKKILPEDLDAAIIDLGSQLETSILATSHLHKMGIKKIVVKARSDEHGEILKLVGATNVVYPDLDAAQHITPMLFSSALFNYVQLGTDSALAEVKVRDELAGKTLLESKLRQQYELNLVAIRTAPDADFTFVSSPSFVLEKDMILFVAGKIDAIKEYTDSDRSGTDDGKKKSFFSSLFRK